MSVINEFGMPFNDVGGDRLYSADDWRTYFIGLVVNGVIGDNGNELAVGQQTVPNKTVKIETGSVFLKGAIRQIGTALNLTIADNTSGNARIDRIVVRLNTEDRKIEFAVKQGTPASSPSAPALIQTDVTYELSLAKIAVANGFSTMVTANITDERTFMAYRDRAVNDRMTELESEVSGVVADMNALEDMLNPAKYYGKYSQLGSGITVSTTSAIMTFAAENCDDFSSINLGTSASRITIPAELNGKKVKFYFQGTLETNPYSGTGSSVSVYKNGSLQQLIASVTAQTGASNDLHGFFYSTPVTVSTGEYYEIYATVAGGSSATNVSNGVFGMEVLG